MDEVVLVNPGGTVKTSSADTVNITNAGYPVQLTQACSRLKMMYFICDVACTATVGNRSFVAIVNNAAGQVVWIGTATANVAASQTAAYDVAFSMSEAAAVTTARRNIGNTAAVNVAVGETCPVNEWVQNMLIRIDVINDIDLADKVTYRLYYVEYD